MKESFLWGLKHKATGGVCSETFVTRQRARFYKTPSFKVVKLVPVEESKKEEKVEEIDMSKLADISVHEGTLKVDDMSSLQKRAFAEYAGKGVWLSSYYHDWKLVKDSAGELCLVAIRKDG